VFRGEGGEDEVDFGGGGEGRVEVDGGGGVEARCLGAEVMGDEAGEVVVSAVAKRAGAAGDLMVAVAVGGVEGMVGGDGLGGRDGGAFWTASEGRHICLFRTSESKSYCPNYDSHIPGNCFD
jgi:hypothetical protein